MGGQQAQLPVFLLWIQALAVPVLGLLAAWIAFQQWRTADRKVQLDLFDRRFAVYSEAKGVVSQIEHKGGCDLTDWLSFMRAISTAPFLFGDEIVRSFEETGWHIRSLARATSQLASDENSGVDWSTMKRLEAEKVQQFYIVLPPLMEPYMKLDHKVWRRPRWARLQRRP